MEHYFGTPIDELRPEECRVRPWFMINGDLTLRLRYPLTENSVVYDIGGFRGDWAAQIYDLYRCRIEIFEPVSSFANSIDRRFADIEEISVHRFGLGGRTRDISIDIDAASSSLLKSGHGSEIVRIAAAAEVISPEVVPIALMKINIEGAEYELLDHLLESGLILSIRDIQVQFHIFVGGAVSERRRLHERLSETHELTFNYPWIWENWRLKT